MLVAAGGGGERFGVVWIGGGGRVGMGVVDVVEGRMRGMVSLGVEEVGGIGLGLRGEEG